MGTGAWLFGSITSRCSGLWARAPSPQRTHWREWWCAICNGKDAFLNASNATYQSCSPMIWLYQKKASYHFKNTTFSYLFMRFCNKVEVITICVTRRPTIIKKCRSYYYKCVGCYKMPRFYKRMQSNVLSSKNFTPVTLRKLFCYSTNSIVTTMLSLKLFNVRLKWLWSQVASASSSF